MHSLRLRLIVLLEQAVLVNTFHSITSGLLQLLQPMELH